MGATKPLTALRAGSDSVSNRAAEAPDALVVGCQCGDMAACEALLEEFRPRIYALVRATGRDPDWVEDTVVEILVQLYRSIGSFQGDSSFATWVYAVAMRACAGELRKAGRQRPWLELGNGHGDGAQNPTTLALVRCEQEQALQAVAQLPPKYRMAVVLRFLCGCSYEELAGVLGIPIGTGKTWVFQGLRRIRRLLPGADGGEEAAP